MPTAVPSPQERVEAVPLPRIVTNRPGMGYFHPAIAVDISRVLSFFGERYTYGVRRIRLMQVANIPSAGMLLFGRLLVPGTVILYAQALPPWVLLGRLGQKDEAKLQRAGAVIELWGDGSQTVVHWPGETLAQFMLFDVLMHELAHHMMQQYKGKRTVRIARTKDHEAFADRFALDCRRNYIAALESDG